MNYLLKIWRYEAIAFTLSKGASCVVSPRRLQASAITNNIAKTQLYNKPSPIRAFIFLDWTCAHYMYTFLYLRDANSFQCSPAAALHLCTSNDILIRHPSMLHQRPSLYVEATGLQEKKIINYSLKMVLFSGPACIFLGRLSDWRLLFCSGEKKPLQVSMIIASCSVILLEETNFKQCSKKQNHSTLRSFQVQMRCSW